MIRHVEKMCQNPDGNAAQDRRLEGVDFRVKMGLADEDVSVFSKHQMIKISSDSYASDLIIDVLS